MKHRRVVSILVCAVFVLAGSLSQQPASASGSIRLAPAQLARAKSQTALANKLAARVYKAATNKARQQALLAVMKALHVGVYTAKGKRVVHGIERSAKDFYLYDFELSAMAQGIGTGQLQSSADLAHILSLGGVKPKGTDLDSDTLRLALLAGVQQAVKQPRNPLSLQALLIRDLGLHHSPPYDMTQDVPDAQLRFDGLQSFLILSDILVPVVTAIRGKTKQTAHVASAASAGSSSSSAVCSEFARNFAAIASNTLVSWGLNNLFFTALAGRLGVTVAYLKAIIQASGAVTFAALLSLILDLIHMNILAANVSVHFDASQDEQETHYGPVGHAPNAGKQLQYDLHVDMVRDVGQTLIDCGPIAGFNFPKKGGIPDVKVSWTTAGVGGLPGLERYGTVVRMDAKTDSAGVATFIFKPKDEIVPGFGSQYKAFGSIHALALYQSSLGGWVKPGALLQLIDPKEGVSHWNVSRHAPRGFKFSGVHLTWGDITGENGNHMVYDLSGQVCSESPYVVWDISLTATNTVGGNVFGPTMDVIGQLIQPGGAGWQSLFSVNFEFLPGTNNNPQMQITGSTPNPGFFTTGQATQTVPVTEDMSCPAPTP